jgi:HK97 family phage portal protein
VIVSGGTPLPFAPQALAEVSPIPSATGYFYASQGVPLLNGFALYGHLYRRQPWVNAVVSKLAKSASRLPINIWDNTGDGEKTQDVGSAYAQFWRRPCPFMPRHKLIRWTWSTRKVYGEAFWVKIRRDGAGTNSPVLGVIPMHPSRTIIQRDKDTGRLTYVFALGVASAGILRLSQEDVVPFTDYNPDDLMRGVSPLEPLRSTLYNEDAARRATESWWTRGARPSLMVSAPNSLSDKAYDRLSTAISSAHGGADNMGGTLLLEEGAKPVVTQLTAEEMQYIQSRILNREEVCGVYDVPPPVVHILDHATFSNITEQMRSMYRDTMAPDLDEFEAIIEYYLTPDFGQPEQLEMRFALDDVLRGDFETRADAVIKLIANGVMKPSEGRPLFDLDDAGEIANRLYANSALQPLGQLNEQVRITAGDPANPLPLNSEEQSGLQEIEAGREAKTAPGIASTTSAARTRSRTAARAAARRANRSPEED